jgi:hypothetical protein
MGWGRMGEMSEVEGVDRLVHGEDKVPSPPSEGATVDS